MEGQCLRSELGAGWTCLEQTTGKRERQPSSEIRHGRPDSGCCDSTGAGRVGHPQAADELEELLVCLRGPQLSAFAFLQLEHRLQSPPGTAACCSDLRISK